MAGNGDSITSERPVPVLALGLTRPEAEGQAATLEGVTMANQLYTGADASRPGAPLPLGTSILAAYVGKPGPGAPDTPHVWTAAEWNEYVDRHPGLRLLPIYVHNYPDNSPTTDAANAVAAVEALGWIPHLTGSARQAIAIDLEVLVAYNWVADLEAAIDDMGFRALPYGSRSYVVQNPSCFGYWVAQLTSRAPTVLPQGARGIQWHWGTSWDLDVFDAGVYEACATGRRRG